jgi:hypothetical protein
MVMLQMPSSLLPGCITQSAAVGLTVRPKVLARVQLQERFLNGTFPTGGDPRGPRWGAKGPVGPPEPLELAALRQTVA